jgi:transaldolase
MRPSRPCRPDLSASDLACACSQALAGVDYLTIAPKLLEELKNSNDEVKQVLVAETAKQDKSMEKVSYIDNEPEFRWSLLEDQMAFEKVSRRSCSSRCLRGVC